MLTRPGVSRPRPRPENLASHYGGTNDAGIPVYCKYNYTVIHCVWKNIGHFDLGLGFERGQGQKHKAKAKA